MIPRLDYRQRLARAGKSTPAGHPIFLFRLKDVLTRLPYMSHSQVPELTPLKWKAAREKTARRAA